MKKIPTLFQRTPDRRYVTDIVTPGCEWVLAGEGVPTRKLDGTCVMFDGTAWWARREVKPEAWLPEGYVLVETDDVTGKRVGWEPIERSPFYKFWLEAMAARPDREPGTYELIGPKINGDPEHMGHHALISHDMDALKFEPADPPADLMQVCRVRGWEGVVWHHPDGRMAKLKVRDYPRVDA